MTTVQMGLAIEMTEAERAALIEKIANLREARKTLMDELGRAEATLIAHMQHERLKVIPGDTRTVKLEERREYDVNAVMAKLVEKVPAADSPIVRDADCRECAGTGIRPPFVDGRKLLQIRRWGAEWDALADECMLPTVPRLIIESRTSP